MKKQVKHTPKKVAKKSATKRVRKAVPANMDCCAKQATEDEFSKGITHGLRLAEEEHARRQAGDPWILFHSHKEEMEDLGRRRVQLLSELSAIDAQMKETGAFLAGEKLTLERLLVGQ